MRKVLISSVVTGFEAYRAAARKAVDLMGDKPVMCEEFGARPYASEVACISEVESSDIYLLIMGEEYGYVGPSGESITQMEFRAAKTSGKPILAFIQNCPMENQQDAFRKEVENFTGGFFRDTFQTPEELKDKIVKSLRQLNQAQQAVTEDEYKDKVDRAMSSIIGYSSRRDPLLSLAYLPQPMREFDIVGIEASLDSVFTNLCAKGVLLMRDGYEPQFHRDWTGLKTRDATVAFFSDSMIVLLLTPLELRNDYFSGSFAPPSRIKSLAAGAFSLVEASGCWAHVKLSGMDHVMVKELPEGKVTSITMRMNGGTEAEFNKLFIPFTSAAYGSWVDQCVKRFQRIFTN